MVDNKKQVKEIKDYAKRLNIPILEDASLKYILNYIKENNILEILEVGSAIGYSSINMALVNENIHITTIEKDQNRYLKALENIKKTNLEKRINLVFNDALEVKTMDKYDLIFIDAAKSKNKEIFKHFEKSLKENGTIITDNLKFHGCVDQDLEKIESRNVRGLVRKIRDYIDFLKTNEYYDTTFLDIGDGLSVTKRKIDNESSSKTKY